jgi:hypothetical protein
MTGVENVGVFIWGKVWLENSESLKSRILHLYGEETARHIRLSKNSKSRKPNSSPPLLSSFTAEITTPYLVSYSSITTSTHELPMESINAPVLPYSGKGKITTDKNLIQVTRRKLPRRKHTTFRTWQKFEVKNNFCLAEIEHKLPSALYVRLHKMACSERSVSSLRKVFRKRGVAIFNSQSTVSINYKTRYTAKNPYI